MRTFTLNNYTYFHREFGCDQNAKENFSILSGQNVRHIPKFTSKEKAGDYCLYT